MHSVGQRLRRARERRALSQRDLARLSGVAYTTIARLERDRHRPIPSTVRKLAAALGVDPAWLLFGEGEETHDAPRSG